MNAKDFWIDKQFLKEPVSLGSVTQHWKGTTLTITVVGENQMCGGVTWTPDYLIEGTTIKVIAKGNGIPMNCPTLPYTFNFVLRDIPQEDYKVTSDISISWGK